jgi:ABC-type branched-subunit amino acid transport system substrate-binding protein
VKTHRQFVRAGMAATIGAGVVILAPLTSTVTAAAASSNPGITSSSVTVGQIDDLSAPVPGLFKAAQDGTQAYFNYINSKGGVFGRKLILNTKDSAGDPSTVVAATQAIANTDFAMVGGFSIQDALEKPIIDHYKLPDVATPNAPSLDNDVNVYSPTPQGNQVPTGPYLWAKETFPKAAPHVGILYPSVSGSTGPKGSQTLNNNAIKATGLHISYERGFLSSEFSFDSDVLRMKKSGVAMYLNQEMPGLYASTLAKETSLQDYHPIDIVGSAAYTNNMNQSSGGTANGMYLEQQVALYEGEDAKTVPEVSLFVNWTTKVDPKVFSSIVPLPAVNGWVSAMLFVQALKAAGPHPTRTSLVSQLNKVTSFDANGLLPPGENPAQNISSKCFLVARLVNGKWTRVNPTPKSGFVCTGTLMSVPGWKPMSR